MLFKCLCKRPPSDEGSHHSKLHFPCKKGERWTLYSFFRECNLYEKTYKLTKASLSSNQLFVTSIDFNSLISKKLYYRIPLKYFVGLGLVNLPQKRQNLFWPLKATWTNFESKAKVTPMPCVPKMQILYHENIPYISCQQISLDDNYKNYLNTTLLSKMTLRTGVQFSLNQVFLGDYWYTKCKCKFSGRKQAICLDRNLPPLWPKWPTPNSLWQLWCWTGSYKNTISKVRKCFDHT